MSFLAELKRRKVFRVAVTYAIVGWVLAQIGELTFPILLLPEWLLRALVIFLILGFPVALILAWSYEIMPDGAARDAGRRQASPPSAVSNPYQYFLIGAGTLALGLLLGGFVGRSSTAPVISDRGPMTGLRLPLHLDGFMHGALMFQQDALVLSRDGRNLAYIGYYDGDQHLYIKGDEDGAPRRIPGTAGATNPFFSPDGSSMGFLLDGTMRRVPVAGGTSVEVAAPVPMTMGATWGDDGTIVFSDGYRKPLKRVSSTGGPISQLTTTSEDENTHRYPQFVPNTNVLLFQSYAIGHPTIWGLNLVTGERRAITNGKNPKFSAGSIIFRRGDDNKSSLWSAALDLETLTLSSDPAPLIGDVAIPFAVAASGPIIYVIPPDAVQHRLLLIDSEGTERVLSESGFMNYPRFSPDGRKVSVSVSDNKQSNIWIFSTEGRGRGTQVTTESGQYMVWDINGNDIAYAKSNTGIQHRTLTSEKKATTIIPHTDMSIPLQWTDQGLLYMQLRNPTNGDIFFRDRSGEIRALIDTDVPTINAQISPNRKWLAYSEIEAGRPTLFVRAFPDGNLRWQVSPGSGSFAKWSADGSTLYYVSRNRILSASVAEDPDGLSFGAPQLVHEFGGAMTITFDPFDISPDGKSIVVVDKTFSNPPSQVYVSDWRDMLPD
jgi:Tol biopolymer transport system component